MTDNKNPMSGETRRCVLMLADGARADVFKHLLSSGRLENISRHIVEPGGFRSASSVFPSTTGPAYTPYLLGKFPGRCALPGIRWLDKKFWDKPLSFRRTRSCISWEAAFLNGDITAAHPTVFEMIPSSVSVFNEITRGLSPENNLTRFSSGFYKAASHFFENGQSIDAVAAGKLLRRFDERALPIFCFAVFMEIDSLSHKLHPFHRKVIDAYLKLDGIVGAVARKLKSRGALEQTLLGIVSDHGLTDTHTHFNLAKFLEKQGFKTLQYPLIFRNFFSADCAVMVSGNSMAHIYLRDCRPETTENLIRTLAPLKEIDIVMSARGNGWIKILSGRGSAEARCEGETIFYKTSGGDPFGFVQMPEKMTKDRQLELTFETRYPDAIVQACQIFESSRSGDIVISAKPGFDLRAQFEFPEHKASHGGLARDHISVPVALSIKTSDRPARTVDILPTALEYLGVKTPENIDGKSLIV